MTLTGHIQNGMVVLDGHPELPDGTIVTVSIRESEPVRIIQSNGLPLVVGGLPGTTRLTNERVNDILQEEEFDSLKRCGLVPS